MSQRTEQGLRRALEFFDRAIVEDPQYAQAYSGLADAHALLSHYGVSPPSEVWTKVATNATSAVLLDEESAEAHTSLRTFEGGAGLGLEWRGAGVSAGDQAESAVFDGPPLVCDVVPSRRWGD